MKPLRIGILSTASIVPRFVGAAGTMTDCKITALASRNLFRAREKAALWNIPLTFGSYEDLIASDAVDIVYIATINSEHARYARLALEAGKHVLCEKSITLNSAELDEARELARVHGVVLMDATTILHMPLYRRLVARAKAGDFGRMNLAQVSFGSFKPYDVRTRFYNRNLAGGAMLDIGVYALSIMRIFMESAPTEMVSLGNTCETGVDVAGGLVCRNAEGQLGVISLTMHSKQPKRAVISFDKCYIEVDQYPRADRARIVWTEDGHIEEVAAGEEAYALCYEMADLERAVAGDQDAARLIDYAADVMRIMTDARAAWGVVYPEEE